VTPPMAPPPVVQPQVVVQPMPAPPPVPPVVKVTPVKKSVLLTPTALRRVSLRTRASDLTGSMTMAVLWSTVATVVFALTSSYLAPRAVYGGREEVHNPLDALGAMHLADPARAGLFLLTTVLGAWAVLVPAKLQEGRGVGALRRRLIAPSLGGAVGACAWWVGETLFAVPQFESAFHHGLFNSVFRHPLQTAAQAPTLAGYVTFFSSLFLVRRWWWQADSFRSKRFRISSLIFT